MDFNQIIPIAGSICLIGKTFFGSIYSFIWSFISYLGFWKCILIILFVIGWIIWEILTQNTHSYNSENGLTPTFNKFIGASVYFWLQTFVYYLLETFFTEAVYCLKWPYFLHITVFLASGLLLHISGIWPYWKIFGKKTRLK